jgi:hypothetical protein
VTLQINACLAGAFPKIVEEVDEDESPHMNTDKTDEGVQGTCPAFDDDLDSEVDVFTIEEDDHVFINSASSRSSPFCPCFEHGVRMSSGSLCQELSDTPQAPSPRVN